MRPRPFLLAFVGLAISLALPTFAQQKDTAADSEKIRALIKAYDEAVNNHNAAAMAALYTEDAIIVTPRWSRLPARRDVHQFRRRLPQRLEIGRFRVGINDRLCDKLDQRRIAAGRRELLLDRHRETNGRIYERIQ